MRVCVFAGSRTGADEFTIAARALGREIAKRGWGMVYGGASVGLMGACANAALEAGAEVIGVLPRGLFSREVAHLNLTRLETVDTLHERKARMHELSDAFVALPGGYGTLDELFEAITWRQLGIHAKPIGLLDVDGFYQPLAAFVARAQAAGFAPRDRLFIAHQDPASLLGLLAQDAGGPTP